MILGSSKNDFPKGFMFGVATAAYQIEGSSNGRCGLSHWDTFSATPGNVFNSDNGSIACDHFNRFENDLDLVKECGFDSYRFSTSWSRVMPNGQKSSDESLAFYDRLVDAICEHGLKPHLTLYHWDLPSELADIGGWMNRETPQRFADYSKAVIEKLGDRLTSVATINEPWCVAWLSYFLGHHAPGLRDVRGATRAMHHVLLAHGLSLEAMRSKGQASLGIVLNLTEVQPATRKSKDLIAAKRLDGIHNRWFLDALFKSKYPYDILKVLEPYMPVNFENDLKKISSTIDWLGINYYTRTIVRHNPTAAWPSLEDIPGEMAKTDMNWEIYPKGLTNLLLRVSLKYNSKIPLIITENGMASPDNFKNGQVHDPNRVKYISEHLNAAKTAIKDGVNLQGFFYWSLMDNFEWAFGYKKRFGLVYVDYETQNRIPKTSFYDLKRFLQSQT